MLQVNDLTVFRGPKMVLDQVTFTLGDGQKAGLVGVNGSGKTTLLKTVMGLLQPEEGEVRKPQRVGYLPQDVTLDIGFPLDGTVGEYVLSALEDYQFLSRAMRHALSEMAEASDDTLSAIMARYGRLEAEFSRRGYYVAQSRAERLLAHLGLQGMDLDREMRTLSGGQKTRLALARLLLSEPDLLLLDEPTNFLDVDATAWFRGFIKQYAGAVLIVSHDLELLDQSIDQVLHLDEFTHKIKGYRGNYTAYKQQRTQQEETARRVFARKQKEIARLQETAARLKTVGRTKSSHRRGQAMLRRVARLEDSLPTLSKDSREVRVDFEVRRRSGRIVVETCDLAKVYGGRPVFSGVDMMVERGETAIVIGLNGTGKTTLLKIIAGLLEPDAGEVELGYNVDLGYYAQEYELLNYNHSVLEEMRVASMDIPYPGEILRQAQDDKGLRQAQDDKGLRQAQDDAAALRDVSRPTAEDPKLRAMLGRFLFSGDKVFQQVGSLSGGERTRLSLAKLVVRGHNLLLLDEPTTYLDPASQETLVTALQDYAGTMIIVSHNVDFVTSLKPDTALIMPEGLSVPYAEDLLALVELT